MATRRELTAEERWKVIGAYECGVSGYTISRKLGFSERTVYDTIDRWKETGSPIPDARPGRPEMLSDRDKRALDRIANKNRDAVLAVVTEELTINIGTTISTKTTSKYLRELGWKSCFKCRKPLLTESHVKARLKWCREYLKWAHPDWRYVVFTDESKFQMHTADGGHRVWRRADEKYHKDCITPTMKFGGGKVMFWGCFSWSGMGPLVRVDGNLDSKGYVELLEEHYIPWAENLIAQEGGYPGLVFQQDNASVDTAKRTRQWMKDNNVDVLPWPAQSPDLSPIENLWHIVDTKVRKNYKDFANDDALADAVMTEWKNIPIAIVHSLIESMPRRLQAVINAKGWHTKY